MNTAVAAAGLPAAVRTFSVVSVLPCVLGVLTPAFVGCRSRLAVGHRVRYSACMRYASRHILVPLLACLPLLTMGATNSADRIELRCGAQVARIALGRDEPASIGSYDVRVYDITNGNDLVFADGLVLPRDGTVTNAWFCDLNGDGQPEIAVWTVVAGSGSYGQLDVLVFADGMLQQVEMPEMAKSWERGYQGHDTFCVEKGVIYRTFPIYKESDTESNPTGGERTLKLIYEKERWMWRLHAVK